MKLQETYTNPDDFEKVIDVEPMTPDEIAAYDSNKPEPNSLEDEVRRLLIAFNAVSDTARYTFLQKLVTSPEARKNLKTLLYIHDA